MLKNNRLHIAIAMIALSGMMGVSWAQDADVEGETPEDDSAPPMALDGDTVVFISGKELRGVRVVRESAIYVEVEYLPNEPVLKIPRTQVARVDYERDNALSGTGDGTDDLLPDIMPGKEVSPEFHRMLMTPLGDALNFEEADYLVVLKEFSSQTGVELEIAEELLAIPETERRFTRTLPPGTTLMSFLRKELSEISPEVRVILQFDKLVLQKRSLPPVESESAPPSDKIEGE